MTDMIAITVRPVDETQIEVTYRDPKGAMHTASGSAWGGVSISPGSTIIHVRPHLSGIASFFYADGQGGAIEHPVRNSE